MEQPRTRAPSRSVSTPRCASCFSWLHAKDRGVRWGWILRCRVRVFVGRWGLLRRFVRVGRGGVRCKQPIVQRRGHWAGHVRVGLRLLRPRQCGCRPRSRCALRCAPRLGRRNGRGVRFDRVRGRAVLRSAVSLRGRRYGDALPPPTAVLRVSARCLQPVYGAVQLPGSAVLLGVRGRRRTRRRMHAAFPLPAYAHLRVGIVQRSALPVRSVVPPHQVSLEPSNSNHRREGKRSGRR
jgi:hypothetical protein